DSAAFGISAAEARSMDPQQSFVLQVGYCAVSRNGAMSRDALARANVGVFLGIEPGGASATRETADAYTASGGSSSVAAGRLSFSLGLVGPCLSIDTACASALVALHVAASALRHGECPSAVAAGTKVLSEAGNFVAAVAGMISKVGRCHSFDQKADGYVRGEGCVAFLLVAYGADEAATRPQLLGTAVQQDGPSASLTAPNSASQRRLLETVRHGADDAARARHLEAHGTGTALGDPIEV
ncbi:beta-ketoacyl synthase, partial [Pelagophyceae sp. CCMP2097]